MNPDLWNPLCCHDPKHLAHEACAHSPEICPDCGEIVCGAVCPYCKPGSVGPSPLIDRSYMSDDASALAMLIRLLRRVHHATVHGVIEDRERCWIDLKDRMRPSIVQQSIWDYEGLRRAAAKEGK